MRDERRGVPDSGQCSLGPRGRTRTILEGGKMQQPRSTCVLSQVDIYDFRIVHGDDLVNEDEWKPIPRSFSLITMYRGPLKIIGGKDHVDCQYIPAAHRNRPVRHCSM